MRLIVETYENVAKRPILTHTFFGKSLAECYRLMGVHAQYDAFLRASLTTGDFHGIKVRNIYHTRA